MEAGSKLGKYEIRGVIGRGAVGVVYEGWDPLLARPVAIKTFALGDMDEEAAEQYSRFQQEAKAAGRLHHPNIVPVFDYGETDHYAYIVMEYLRGGALKARLERGRRLAVEEALSVMDGLLAGLSHSHANGVVHRDIKPANVVFGLENEVKITDFGIARLESSSLTMAGAVIGTPAYMSPEQVLGEAADSRSDLYSVGVILYEMLTGKRPFEGSASSIMHKIVHMEPPRPSELTTETSVSVPPWFDAVIERALAKAPADRFQTAAEFAAALRDDGATIVSSRIRMEPVVTKPIPMAAQPVRSSPAARSPKILVAAGASTVVVAAMIGWWMMQSPNGPAGSQASVPPPTALADATPSPPPVPSVQADAMPPPPPAAPAAPAAVEPSAPPHVDPTIRTPLPPAASADAAGPLRLAVAGPIATMPCSLIQADFAGPRDVALKGVTSLGETSELMAEGALRGALSQIPQLGDVNWRIRRVDGPFCDVLDLLRPMSDSAAPPGSAVGIGGGTTTNDGVIRMTTTLPAFTAGVIVDRYNADGSVIHLVPQGAATSSITAGMALTLPESNVSSASWKISSADGVSLVTVIASTQPLVLGPRAEREPAAAYLKDLEAALTGAQKREGRIAVAAAAYGPPQP